MALELKRFVDDQLHNLPENHHDREFLQVALAAVNEYLRPPTTPGTVFRVKNGEIDLSKIPFDVCAKDESLVHFIAAMDLPLRIKRDLVTQIARDQHSTDKEYRVDNIYDLYTVFSNPQISYMRIRNVGKKSVQMIVDNLKTVAETGEFPKQIDGTEFHKLCQSLQMHYQIYEDEPIK